MKPKPFSEEDLRKITQAYFSLTTREIIEAEILILRAGGDVALPLILDEALAHLKNEASTKEYYVHSQDPFDNKKKKYMNYIFATTVFDGTIESAYDVCKRLGQQTELHLASYLDLENYKMQLLTACILYKYEILQRKTIEKIKYITVERLKHKQNTSLYFALLLILHKAGDLNAKAIIKNKVVEIKLPEDKVLEDTYYSIVLDLAGESL